MNRQEKIDEAWNIYQKKIRKPTEEYRRILESAWLEYMRVEDNAKDD